MPHQLKRIAYNTFTRAFDPLLTGSSGSHASNPTIAAAQRARPDLILAITTRWLVLGNTSNPGVLYDGAYRFEPWTVHGPCSKGTRKYDAYDANQWAACCNAYGEGVTYANGGTCT